jgi:hypothetical protein
VSIKGEVNMSGKFKFDWDKVKESVVEDAQKKKGFQADPRMWRPTVDDKGNATAIFRFLPDRTGTPYAKYYAHNFNYMLDGVKKYWIRNCINTFGYDKDCPICKKNQEYWNSAFEQDKSIASQRKRKLIFMSNILVIKNPANPETEGNVYLYSYGQKIYDKIKDKMFPAEDVKALGEYDEYVPFDLYEGANFKFVQVKQGEFPNYDKSEFGKQGPVGKDPFIEDIMSKVYDLTEFMAEDKFPTNEEVIKVLGSLLGITPTSVTPKKEESMLLDDIEDLSTNALTDEPLTFDSALADDEDTEDEDANFFKNLK